MKIDLKSMSRKELEKFRIDVEKALEKLKAKDKRAAQKAAAEAASKFGFTLNELAAGTTPKSKAKAKKPATTAKPRFANPDNKDQTWTGKGRQPEWYKAQIANGAMPKAMEI